MIKLPTINEKSACHLLCSDFRRVVAEEWWHVDIAIRDETGRDETKKKEKKGRQNIEPGLAQR